MSSGAQDEKFSSELTSKSYRIRVFVICLTAWTLSSLDQSLFGYAVPNIMADLGISLRTIGLMLSVGFVSALFVTLIAGLLADRFGRRITLVGCLALSALCVGLIGFAGSFMSLLILRALGFSLGNGLSPITSTYICEAATPRYRGLWMGMLQCGYPLGWFLASLIAAPIMASYGWRAVFLCAFAVIPLALLLYVFLPESRRFQNTGRDRASIPMGSRIQMLFSPHLRRRTITAGLAYFMFGGAYAGSAFYLPTFFQVVRGYDESTATHIVGTAYGIGIVGYLTAALVGEFITTRRNTISIWCALGTASMLALVWLPRSPLEDMALFGLMAMFSYGATAVLQAFVMELFPTHLRATGAALSASAGLCLGFAIFPVLTAWIIEAIGWQLAFTFAIAPPLLLCGILVLTLDNLKSGAELSDD